MSGFPQAEGVPSADSKQTDGRPDGNGQEDDVLSTPLFVVEFLGELLQGLMLEAAPYNSGALYPSYGRGVR